MKPNSPHRAFIALGSNQKIPLDDLKNVPNLFIQSLEPFTSAQHTRLSSISPYYSTPAFPKGSGPDFVNAAFEISTTLAPDALLQQLHALEDQFGRERPYRWSPRTLDLDLIFYDALIAPDLKTWQGWADLAPEAAQASAPEHLILPHPRAHERGFVLAPLVDIAPDFEHPVLKTTLRTLLQNLPQSERASLKRL